MPQRTYGLRIPLALHSDFERRASSERSSVSKLVKNRLSELLATEPTSGWGIEPPQPRSPGTSVMIGLNDEQQAQMQAWRALYPMGADDPQFLAGLLVAGSKVQILRGDTTEVLAEPSFLDELNAALGQKRRAHQDKIYKAARTHLRTEGPSGSVLFSEGSTGIGKTRAALAAAVERLIERPDIKGWVTCPSLALIRQASSELAMIARSGVPVPPWRCIFGRQEFVSDAALAEHIQEFPELESATKAWIGRGGRNEHEGTEMPGYLIDSLSEAWGREVPIDDSIRLRADHLPDDYGAIAYAKQFDVSAARLLIFSHAMLAFEIRASLITAYKALKQSGQTMGGLRSQFTLERKQDNERIKVKAEKIAKTEGKAQAIAFTKKEREDRPEMMLGAMMAEVLADTDAATSRLGECGFLIVDEAHLLEQNCAKALSYSISAWKLLQQARTLRAEKPTIKAESILALQSAYADMQGAWIDAQSKTGQTTIDIAADERMLAAARSYRNALDAILKSKGLSKFSSKELTAIKSSKKALDLAVPEAQVGHRAYATTSPVLRHPLLMCGRGDISLELGYLWAKMAPRAVLLSATLAIGNDAPYEYSRRILGVSSERFSSIPPISPPWLTSCVTLYQPAKSLREDGTLRFAPPPNKSRTEKDDLYRRWVGEVVEYIERANASAAGGTLVLANSYADLDEIANAIRGRNVLALRPGKRLRDVEPEFYRLALDGARPILIATGQAWTGMDMGGHSLHRVGLADIPASEDEVLTDLIILRMPFGVHSTISHLRRMEVYGFIAESYATAFMEKQGIGRLVRREGLPNDRKIHVLDGRLNDPAATSMWTCRQVLASYTNRVSF